MHFTEIPGKLVLTFNSIPWSFIYKVLRFFGFGEYIIQYVKILNTNFKTAVLQVFFFYQTNFLLREDEAKARGLKETLLHFIYFFFVPKFYQL